MAHDQGVAAFVQGCDEEFAGIDGFTPTPTTSTGQYVDIAEIDMGPFDDIM